MAWRSCARACVSVRASARVRVGQERVWPPCNARTPSPPVNLNEEFLFPFIARASGLAIKHCFPKTGCSHARVPADLFLMGRNAVADSARFATTPQWRQGDLFFAAFS